jgi:ATP-dependent DNA helicase DinG
LPLPGAAPEARHDEATVRGVLAHAEISDGGIFVLFTSYRALRHVASELLARSEGRWPLFVHGEAPRGQLLERFAASGRGILLGTLSFWEGVDVPGEALRGLVIPRLPFRVPSEPVTAARIEAIEAAGGNAFYRYLLPLAAIRLKQGFGRLIRTRDDRGVVLILDGRIAKRRYGGYLRGSLPPARYVAGPWREVREEMEQFYHDHA